MVLIPCNLVLAILTPLKPLKVQALTCVLFNVLRVQTSDVEHVCTCCLQSTWCLTGSIRYQASPSVSFEGCLTSTLQSKCG